jgi:hypothetical protein
LQNAQFTLLVLPHSFSPRFPSFRSSSSSGSDSLSSGGEDDDDPVPVSDPYFRAGSGWEEDDEAVPAQDTYNPAGSRWLSSVGEEDDDNVPVLQPDDFSHAIDQYCAAFDTFASEMHNAAAHVEH